MMLLLSLPLLYSPSSLLLLFYSCSPHSFIKPLLYRFTAADYYQAYRPMDFFS